MGLDAQELIELRGSTDESSMSNWERDERTTYIVNEQSQLPSDLVIGKTVTILPLTDSNEHVAKTVTYEVVPR
jgi:hypothetical protein